MTPEQSLRLRAPFPPEAIGKIPKGGALLDYVGHAATTDRLLQVDPDWTWEPPTSDELQRLPGGDGMWIKLTVCGVTRFGWGDGKNIKEWISDAIRNAAMRFGVALDLWSKEDLRHDESAEADSAGKSGRSGPTGEQVHSRPAFEPSSAASATSPVESGKGPADTTTPPSAGPKIGANKLQQLRARASALVAENQPVADKRMARGLPKLDKNCTDDEATSWDLLLMEMEQELAKPFTDAK